MKLIFGILIIAVFMAWSVNSFISTTITYVSLEDVADSDGTVQVMGKIDFASVNFDTENSRFSFDITDLEEPESNRRLKIVYGGTIPGNFDQAKSVVAKGIYQDGVLVTKQLLVKCPSKYQGLDQGA